MARGPRTVKPAGPLDAVHQRIREAEKKTAPLARESVGLDAEGYEHLALCIERGLGRKPEVLRQALAAGLRVLVNGSAPETVISVAHPLYNEMLIEREMVIRENGDMLERPVALTNALGLGGAAFGNPITVPPSQQRRIEAGDEPEDETDGNEEEF